MLVHLHEITAQHAFGTPRLEPGYVIPIIRRAWPQLAPSQIVAQPVPMGRLVEADDEWDRLLREYGHDAVRAVYTNPESLAQRMEQEAEMVRELKLTCEPDLPAVNKPLFHRATAVPAPVQKVRRRKGMLVAE